MTARALRKLCLGFPGAVEEFPFSPTTSVFKVEGKIFAISALDGRPLDVSLKCEPGLAEQLRASHEAIRPGYHLNKRHWNTVVLDGSLSDAMVGTWSRTPTTSWSAPCRERAASASAGRPTLLEAPPRRRSGC